ncbi:hypothetical protein LTR56_019216 [Elasticomyces elasticus]|nr:hypothetical protein LTR56_019216 [Elasticomyces elasticus]KAK3633224.1 hypothetical protein LTR22_020224 [Elasticomyces elasticus]KAK4910617.1 hypothetical protein LTR49_020749 [Elasticomyces elasticus]KAK5751028.1 hypothetical protein LTS12_018929 [Elasticomyces elasticus]
MAEHLARQYLHKHIADAQTIFDLKLELATQQVKPLSITTEPSCEKVLIENAQLRSALAEKEGCIKDLRMRLELKSDGHEIEMAAVQLKLADKQAKQDVGSVAPWSTLEDCLEYSSSHGHVSALTPASSTSNPTSDDGDDHDGESMEDSKTSGGSGADGRNLQTVDEVKSESKLKQGDVEERQVETDEEAGMSNGASSDPQGTPRGPEDIEESDVALQQVAGTTAAGLLHTEINGGRTRPSAAAFFSPRSDIQVIEGYAERVERLADLKESIVRGTSDAYVSAEYKRLEKVRNEHLKTALTVPTGPLRFDGTLDAQLNEIVEDTFKSSTRVFRAANRIFPDNKELRIKEYLSQAQDYLLRLPGFENKAYMKPVVTSFMQKVAANLHT